MCLTESFVFQNRLLFIDKTVNYGKPTLQKKFRKT